MRILIVDDDPLALKALQIHLKRWDYQVVCARDGVEALEILKASQDISMLITDWRMPQMTGLQLCREARKIDFERYLHIIMLTARSEKSDLLEGMEAGADAYLTKPYDPLELRAQLRVGERVIRLEDLLADRLNELTEAHEKLQADLRAAAQIQQSLLPQEKPQIDGMDFGWIFDSCDAVAGDTFNVFRLDEEHLGMYILDVCGHGVQAALLSVTLSHSLNPLPHTPGIIKRKIPNAPYYQIVSPVEVARDLHQRVRGMGYLGQYFTFLYGILHLSSRRFTYCRAGHPYPIHIHNGQASYLEAGEGLPIGLDARGDFDQQELQLTSGDKILFYTDGVIEALNSEGQMFGSQQMLDVVAQVSSDGTLQLLTELQSAVKDFVGGAPRRDDLSLIGFGLK